MITSWPEAFSILQQEEGYDADYKADPGGPTFMGISSVMWPIDYRKVTGLWKSGDHDGAIQAAKDFYESHYWHVIDADNLSYPLDVCAFSCAVNMGQGIAERFLKATQSWRDFLFMMLQRYTDNAEFSQFGHGWLNRVLGLWARYYSTK